MDIWVLDKTLEANDIVDTFNSLIWTDRYDEYGDFEIYTSVTDQALSLLQMDYYLQSRSSEHVMIIEEVLIDTDPENGNSVTITGRSLESLLSRRIVWTQTLLDGSVQDCIKKLLDENVISPKDVNRKIPNFVFETSVEKAVTEPKITAQFTGDNLYDVISEICRLTGLGFKVTLNDKKQFVFKLYAGADRTYAQTENPYVVFSPKFENIANSNYLESKKEYKNVALVAGEGEGAERKTTSVGEGSGLERRELFVDARDISTTTEDNVTLSDEEYKKQLAQRGDEKLADTNRRNTDTAGRRELSQKTKRFFQKKKWRRRGTWRSRRCLQCVVFRFPAAGEKCIGVYRGRNRWASAAICGTAITGERAGTVSYTHLDVYKRQAKEQRAGQ